ncbi:putative spore protein YtfJ [Azospirillum lipoferum]|uniref:Glycine zipper domain-containing protein n=1 Tax=Azospirillum lipoferum TaxID=193 RepID=A0A5A9GXH3_AZOLI|nr:MULTISPECIES: hypothetical protein [Azospirillum]KAA0598385.1 hypothetical protein FZ942_04700 [Azospirillum lipoferum]MCP1609623.1 putative spore protein YtfJ [Azospirillum lipoferum]MDW5535070.1 hypothetical protein [Azospirillum sp. NL1]
MHLLHLSILGLALATAACGANMEEKSATGGLGGAAAGAVVGGPVGAVVGAAAGAGAGAATQKIEDRNAQSGSGATYSAPASRSTVTR